VARAEESDPLSDYSATRWALPFELSSNDSRRNFCDRGCHVLPYPYM
jgi:hypothetical protein